MKPVQVAYLWPSAKNYPAFKKACVERMDDSHAEWVARNSVRVEQLRAAGHDVQLIDVDVAALKAWCLVNATPVNTQARSRFAAYMLMMQQEAAAKPAH